MNTETSSVSFASQGWSGDTSLSSRDRNVSDPVTCELSGRLDRAEYEAQFSAAVLELVNKLAQADDLQGAGLALVSELQDYFGCQRVILGLCRRNSRNCRLLALSGLAQFDARSEYVRIVESALEECVLRGSQIIWPAPSEAARHATLAHQRLASASESDKVIGVPLRGVKENIVGAILFLGAEQLDRPAGFHAFLRVCERQLGKWIELVQRAEPGSVTQLCHRARRHLKRWQGRAALAAAVLMSAAMALPLPYKIKCDCQVQPFTRRYIVAPFEGRLEKSLVKQGDFVTQGQLLARLDGRELRWELAGLVAERSRAAKQRDSAMATQKVADAQAAKLEMDRLDLKIQLLEHRIENLDVRSPIDGIVISGDLERAEGAPLTIGQTLFEVAPLDNMVVELAVPEADISYAHKGQGVTVRLDAYPERAWQAAITSIHPRAEIRQSQNAFIAEVHLDNANQELRPGMNGSAKVLGPRKPLAWNLFHKAADWIARMLGC
jgi:RND family efflux transporter MFP subunit